MVSFVEVSVTLGHWLKLNHLKPEDVKIVVEFKDINKFLGAEGAIRKDFSVIAFGGAMNFDPLYRPFQVAGVNWQFTMPKCECCGRLK